MVCCHSQVIQRGNVTSLDSSLRISCSSAKNSCLLWLPKIFFLALTSVRPFFGIFVCGPLQSFVVDVFVQSVNHPESKVS